MRFVLGSASPARLATLRSVGIEPEVIVSHIDESAIAAEDMSGLVIKIAQQKLLAVAPQVNGEAIILTCDSMLEFEGESFGKPEDAEAAVARWKRMRGNWGTLWTGHCLMHTRTGIVIEGSRSTAVKFANVADEEIDWYVSTGEPLKVAGAFTIDGLGGWFIEQLRGDHLTVVGLSLSWLRVALAQIGVSIADLVSSSAGHPG